jgi:hypothetical protein
LDAFGVQRFAIGALRLLNAFGVEAKVFCRQEKPGFSRSRVLWRAVNLAPA